MKTILAVLLILVLAFMPVFEPPANACDIFKSCLASAVLAPAPAPACAYSAVGLQPAYGAVPVYREFNVPVPTYAPAPIARPQYAYQSYGLTTYSPAIGVAGYFPSQLSQATYVTRNQIGYGSNKIIFGNVGHHHVGAQANVHVAGANVHANRGQNVTVTKVQGPLGLFNRTRVNVR